MVWPISTLLMADMVLCGRSGRGRYGLWPISSFPRWPSGTVPDLRTWGRRFESRPWLLCTNANSACHPYGVGKWVVASRAAGWRPSAADWGGGMSVVLRHGSNCPLSLALDGWILRRGTTSSRQSASATYKIVTKRCCSRVFSCKQRNIKYRDPLHLPLGVNAPRYVKNSVKNCHIPIGLLWEKL